MCGCVYVCVFCNVLGVLVICVLVFTVFCLYCVFCIVSLLYIYSYLFCLYQCKDYGHQAKTKTKLVMTTTAETTAATTIIK